MAPSPVRAAGALVVRAGEQGDEVLVVHRPRYDDWSFPKGKCDGGETFAETAVREVLEETGHQVVLGADLGEVRYHDQKDRPKVVRYWVATLADARSADAAFAANDEVDEIRWVRPEAAATLLSYHHDADLLKRLAAAT
jgi:8-oxo-dGTP diphosphatase